MILLTPLISRWLLVLHHKVKTVNRCIHTLAVYGNHETTILLYKTEVHNYYLTRFSCSRKVPITSLKEHTSHRLISKMYKNSSASITSNSESTDFGTTYLESNTVKTCKKMNGGSLTKAPNILVYCEDEKFPGLLNIIQQCVNKFYYTVYPLKKDSLKMNLWKTNSTLLIVLNTSIPREILEEFNEYYRKGGRVLCIGYQMLDEMLQRQAVDKHDSCATTEYQLPNGKLEVMFKELTKSRGKMAIIMESERILLDEVFESKEGQVILKDVLGKHLDINCSSETGIKLTPYFMYTTNKKYRLKFIDAVNSSTVGKIKLSVHNDENILEPVTSSQIHVIVSDNLESQEFDVQQYFTHLSCNTMGRVLLYASTVTTTMDICNSLQCDNVVVTAARQLCGKGRGGNQWVSPDGCAMFTFPINVPLKSRLGQNITFLQHLVSIAILEGITSNGYNVIKLRLKWPNDIYYKDKAKIGGFILNASIMGNMISCLVGCGVNVKNSQPTTCLNNLIVAYNEQHNTKLAPVAIEQVIAWSLSRLEELIEDFQTRGTAAILPTYYKYWLHSGQEVTIHDGVQARIVGLDEHGFLSVVTLDGRKLSLQPDGNSLDMLANLITIKPPR